MLDCVIRGGEVVDGTGAPGRRADVGIRDGRIVAIGDVSDEAGAPDDRRRRQGRRAGLRRHPHALRRAGVLRHDAEPVAAARRDDGDRRQLRLHDRAARARARRLPDAHARPRRGHVARSARRRRAVGLEDVRRVPRPHRRHARAERRLPRRPLDDPARRHGRATRPGRRRRPTTSRRWSSCSPRASPPAASGSRRRGRRTHNDAEGDMVPSRYATEDELIALCKVVSGHPGTTLEFIPCVGPVRGLRSRSDDAHVARREPPAELERAVRVGRQRSDGRAQPRGVRLRAPSAAPGCSRSRCPTRRRPASASTTASCSTRSPGWQKPMTLPHDEKKAMLATGRGARRAREAAAQGDGPASGIANWRRST